MQRCLRCDRTYPNTEPECPYCHYREEPAADVARHIDFLLGEIPQWVQRDWLDRGKASVLQEAYTRRRSQLVPPATPEAPLVAVHRPVLARPKAPEEPPASERRAHPLSAFLEERNVSYWHLMGTLLLIAGLTGLIRATWGSVGKYLVFAVMIGLTFGLWALGKSITAARGQVTGWTLRAIALLLVPLDIIAVNAFALSSWHLSANTIGLVTAALCLPLYAWEARRERVRCFDILLALNVAAGLHFLVQTSLPALLGRHGPVALLGAYGFFYLPVALAYLVAASRSDSPERRRTWIVSAHAMVLGSLVLAVWPGGGRSLGETSATVLLATLLYASSAFLFDDALYAWLSGLLGLVGVCLAFAVHQAPAWYVYGLAAQALAFAALWLSRLHGADGRSQAAQGYRASAWMLSSASFLAQVWGAAVIFSTLPRYGTPAANLYGAAGCALLSLVFFAVRASAWRAASYIAQGFFAYLFVIMGLLLARALPAGTLWHEQPQIALPLALAAGAFLILRQIRSAIAASLASLVICVCYALAALDYRMTVASLVFVMLVMACGMIWRQARIVGLERAAALWTLAGSSVVACLLWEKRLLPLLAHRAHLEQNYGYGLLVIILAAVALGRRQSRTGEPVERLTAYQIAGVLGVVSVFLQLGYAVEGLIYSPLVLLGVGVLVAGIWSLVFRSTLAAGYAAGLTASVYLAFLFGNLVVSLGGYRPSHPAEILLTALLAVASALLALAAGRLLLRIFVAWAVLAGTLAVLHAAHLLWHPALVIYSQVLLVPVCAVYVIALAARRKEGSFWSRPLEESTLFISVLALLPVVYPLFAGPSRTLSVHVIEALAAYGLLYALVAGATRQVSYVYLCALAVDAAYLGMLFRSLHSLGAIGFDLGIAALGWVLLAVLLALTIAVREEITLAFHHVGTAIVAAALLFAGFGDGPGHALQHTLLAAGVVFFGNLWRMRREFWQHLGVAAWLSSYFLVLSQGQHSLSYASGDLYFAPAGAYLLFLGWLARRRGTNAQAYNILGLAAMMGPTLIAIHSQDAPAFRAPVLATECAAAVFYGLAARIKAFAGAGFAFLLALIAVEAQGNASPVEWAIYATVLGLAIIASALLIERRRDDVIRWTASVREKMKQWE